MRYALEYADPQLNGAMTFTVRLVDADSRRPYRDGRFDLLDEDAALDFCRQCAADLAGVDAVGEHDGADPGEAHVGTLMSLLAQKVAETLPRMPKAAGGGSRRRRTPPRRFRPFPTALLPGPVARYVREAAASLGCDESFVALPVLVLLGSAIGTTRRICLKRTWREYPIVWAVVVAASGAKKSPPFDLALAPLQRLQREAFRRWEQALKAYEEARILYERDLSAFKRTKKDAASEPPQKPEPPVLDHYVVSDTTVEALAPILRNRPRGVMLYRDELSGWLGGMNQYKAKGGADAAHWLEMFGGRPMKVDRKGGLPLLVPRAAVWVTGSIQPGTLRRCLGDEHFENGMAARPLYACPPRRQSRWSERELDPVVEAGLANCVERLLGLAFATPAVEGGEPAPVDVPLSAEAKRAWATFVDEHGAEQFTLGDGALAAAWSKLEGYAARLALIVHFARWACDDPALASPDEVDAQSIAAGVALSRWFGGEAERLYGTMRESDEEGERRELVELVRHLGGRVTVRDLQRHCRRYADAADATAALAGLVEAGLGRFTHPAPSVKGGRPARVFELVEPEDKAHEGLNPVDVTETPDADAPAGVLSTDPPSGVGVLARAEGVSSTAKGVVSTATETCATVDETPLSVDETPLPAGQEPRPGDPLVDKTPAGAAGIGVLVTSTAQAAPAHKDGPDQHHDDNATVVEVDV